MFPQFYQALQNLVPDVHTVRFLLAVSGGRDSVALAHLFAKGDLKFDIAHCNFHLRGEESNKEMQFVQNLPFLTTQKVFVKEFDTQTIRQKSGKSIEMIARELRYQWFEEIGKTYHYIVTAHHANDNAETMLLNLMRGTGLRGLCGIPEKNGKIIRPLLRFLRSEIEQYCREQDVRYCDDSSNFLDEFLRNKVRNKVIPELEKINPNIIDVFSKNSQLFIQQTQFFDAQIQQYKNQMMKETPARTWIAIDELQKIEYQSLVLYEMLHPYGFNAVDVENILKSLDAPSGKQFLSNTHILIKDRTHFILEKKNEKKDKILKINNIDELKQHGFEVEKIPLSSFQHGSKSSNVIYIDAEKLIFPLIIRDWQQGDYFFPFGMKTRKKLSDFFTDLKIDCLEKQKIRLLCTQEQIIWIINYRADNRFRVGEGTREILMIRRLDD